MKQVRQKVRKTCVYGISVRETSNAFIQRLSFFSLTARRDSYGTKLIFFSARRNFLRLLVSRLAKRQQPFISKDHI